MPECKANAADAGREYAARQDAQHKAERAHQAATAEYAVAELQLNQDEVHLTALENDAKSMLITAQAASDHHDEVSARMRIAMVAASCARDARSQAVHAACRVAHVDNAVRVTAFADLVATTTESEAADARLLRAIASEASTLAELVAKDLKAKHACDAEMAASVACNASRAALALRSDAIVVSRCALAVVAGRVPVARQAVEAIAAATAAAKLAKAAAQAASSHALRLRINANKACIEYIPSNDAEGSGGGGNQSNRW